MTEQLIVLANGNEMGTVFHRNARLSFIYNESWRQNRNSYPLSLSMPLASAEHSHARVHAFLWGLLPDNDRVLENWAKRFHVSARNAFRLIANVGEDCAGAVQFVRPERLQALRKEPRAVEIAWLTEDDIAKRLATLRADHSAWRTASDTGQFSLAGAQPKTAMIFENGRWGIPSGRAPTTHILKPPTGEWDGHAENEHFCLLLARRLGLVVPNSRVRHFRNEVAIVIERYDRVRRNDKWFRVHQENMCQASGTHPAHKYENEGGPGVRKIVELLRQSSNNPAEDVQSFLDAIAFNWLIAGTDAHAKNYAFLLGGEGAVRLAPLYDLASVLPYRAIDINKARLAMKLGGEYRLRNISIRNWRRLAAEVRIAEDSLIDRIRSMAGEIPNHAADIQRQLADQGLSHPLIVSLARKLRERANACRSLLD
ncbi:MAG TPA: type II toxin-antitoxin system HipA family toxin [Candidatus Binataceae bacterium]|nr:type II toxin-antitoxin system HipA family toxin [Candidatus Binataceae bacterium]